MSIKQFQKTLKSSMPEQSCDFVTLPFAQLLCASGRRAEYCDERACLCVSLCDSVSVCPRAYLRNYMSSLHHYVHIMHGCGLVLLRRRCDTLCTSGFVDDITCTLLCIMAWNTQGEVTSQSLWSRYDRHFVGVTI